jgi:hypothetical protein
MLNFITLYWPKVDKRIPSNLGSQFATFHIFVLKLKLKEFPKWCILQFTKYIWFVTQKHNMNNYLDQIQQENQITIDSSRVLG